MLMALFEGRANPLQKALIAEQLNDSKNQEFYFICLEEWEQQNPQLIVDSGSAYARIYNEDLNPNTKTDIKCGWGRPIRITLQLVAAILLLVIPVSYFFRDTILNHTYETTYGEIKSFTLADGSNVTLNANSSLQVPRFGFGNKAREVFLSGEAEFSVRHLSTHHRFIVKTPDQLEIQVLGTEFMVYSRSRGSKVVLTKGKVQVRSLKKKEIEPIIITPGDVVSVSTNGILSLSSKQNVETYSGWKEHRFNFENTSVSEIATQLNEVFGIQLIIPDSSLAKRTLGGTIQAENAEKFLNVMADILEVRVVATPENAHSPHIYTLTY